MEKFKDIVQKNITKIMLIGLTVTMLGSLWSPSKDIAAYMFNDEVSSMIQHMITESVKESIEIAKVDYSLQLMILETKNIRDTAAIDEMVLRWQKNKWNAQLVALYIVAKNEYAKNKLKESMYSAQVYKALIGHAK